MANAFNYFYSFSEALHEGVHDLSPGASTLKVALTNSAPATTNTQLTDITEISYTNIQDGATTGRDVTINASSGQTTGNYKLIADDLILTAIGAVPTFRYVVVYDDTATNDELIGWYDYGVGGITLASAETFTIDFDGTNGMLSQTWV